MLKTSDHSSAPHLITQGMNNTKSLSFCSSPFTLGHQLTSLLFSSASPQEISLGGMCQGRSHGPDSTAIWDERGTWLRCWSEGCTAMSCPWGSPCSETRVEPRFHKTAWAPGFHFHAYYFSFRVLFNTQFIQLGVVIAVNTLLKNTKLLHWSKGMSPNLETERHFSRPQGLVTLSTARSKSLL